MDAIALIIAVVALIISILAYQRTEGTAEVKRRMESSESYAEFKKQVESLGTMTDALREKTADALERLEQVLRKTEKSE